MCILAKYMYFNVKSKKKTTKATENLKSNLQVEIS